MKYSRFFSLVLVLCMLMTGLSIQGVYGREAQPENGYIVKLLPDAPMLLAHSESRQAAGSSQGIREIPYAGGFYVADTIEDIRPLIEAGLVEYYEPNDILYLLGDYSATDPLAVGQWYLETMGIDSAWDAELDGRGVTIAVVDSGLRASHEDLAGIALSSASKSFLTDTSLTDTTGHGTFVSGIIAAQRDNGLGLAGLTHRAEIMTLRCFDGQTTNTATVVSALSYAVQQGADIINMSFGGTSYTLAASLRDVLEDAAARNVLLIAAAGNSGTAAYHYPAALSCVIGVGMVDSTNTVADRSQKNDSVFVTAPGAGVPGLGYLADNAYVAEGSGTSYAAPVISSLAAMARQVNPAIGMEGFRALLKMSAEDKGPVGYDVSYGYGVVRADWFTDALLRNYSIQYHCGENASLNGTAGVDYPNSYKIGRAEPVGLPTPVREGFDFNGWYTDSSCAGTPVFTIPAGAVGDIVYYAGWTAREAEPDLTLASVVVKGVTAVQDAADHTVYHVTLPGNAGEVLPEDIAVIPAGSGVTAGTPQTADGGSSWTLPVGSAVYTINITISGTKRPLVSAAVPRGNAVPASADGKTPGSPCILEDISAAFTDVDEDTVYAIAACSGAGNAELAGRKLSYMPSEDEAGSTVTIFVSARNGDFISEGTAVVTVTVDGLPPSDSTVSPVFVEFQEGEAADLAVTLNLFGNTLISVSCNSVLLTGGVHYAMDGMPAVGSAARELTIGKTYLNSLSAGAYTLKFTFSGGRTEQSKQAVLSLNITPKSGGPGDGGGGSGGGTGDGGGSGGGTGGGTTGPGPVVNQPLLPPETETPAPVVTPPVVKPPVVTLPLIWDNPYSDVLKNEWFYDAVGFVYDRGLFKGTGSGKFSPRVTMTRGMFAAVLHRYAGQPPAGSSPFSDVASGSYYEQAIAWAASKDIVSGGGGNSFAPDAPVTRQQLAVILMNYAMHKGYDLSTTDLAEFSDARQISSYAVTAMKWAVAHGLITGRSGKKLDPQGTALRCEVAAIMMRFCETFGE